MFTPSEEKIRNVLRFRGIDPAKLATSAKDVDSAVGIVRGMIPIPLRWIVDRERVRQAVMRISAKEIYR
jgi:hypothetical protein